MKHKTVDTRSPCTRKGPQRSDAGFSLLELLVVLTIIGLLTTLVAPKVTKYLSGARSGTATAQMSSLAQALELYRLEVGRLPSQEAGLRALVERPANRPRWNGPYLDRASALTDPWGSEYQYRIPGTNSEYDLFSLGADQAVGGTGDDADVWFE